MNFFKKRRTAWTLFRITVVFCFFVGQGKKNAGNSPVKELPSGNYVQDKRDVLSPEIEEYLNKMNNGLKSETGREIQIVTVNTTSGKNVYDAALDYGDSIGLGGKSSVIYIAVEDSRAIIVQGIDLYNAPRGLFTDENLDNIRADTFASRDFATRQVQDRIVWAFERTVDLYEEYFDITVEQSGTVTLQQSTDSAVSGLTWLIIAYVRLVLFIIIIVAVLLKPRRRRVVPMGTTRYYPRNNPPRGYGSFSGGRTSSGGSFSGGRSGSSRSYGSFSGGRSSSTRSSSSFSGGRSSSSRSSFSGGRSSFSGGRSSFSGGRSSFRGGRK